MRHHRRFSGMPGLLIGVMTLVGCVTDGEPTADAPGFPWVTVSDVPRSRHDLKNAARLDLAYAQLQEQAGNLPEAEQAYRRVLEDDSASLDARLGLARISYRSERGDEAERSLRAILKDAPDNPMVLIALGQVLASEQRWNEAVSLMERAVVAKPDEPLYRHHLAVTLARSGEGDRAFDEFAKVHGKEVAQRMVDEISRSGHGSIAASNAASSASPIVQTSALKSADGSKHETAEPGSPSR